MDALLDEVESLEAILMDDVRIVRNSQSSLPEIIETTIYPVVDNESDQQYVCVTLQVIPTPGYPEISPEFKLIRPRGLDDTSLEAIRTACQAKLKDAIGFPVVFDLIEVVRELLTNTGNLPSGQCVVCLYGFTEGDEFARTECFHYLHSYCLARHLNALRRNYHEEYNKLPAWQQKTAEPFQALCPVCREPIADDSDSLKCAMPPAELQNAPEFQLTDELRELQQRMNALFLEQKSRGAIIDVEAESGSVISIETEQDLRRRSQRKQDRNRGATAAAAVQRVENCNNNATSTSTTTHNVNDSSKAANISNTNEGQQQQQPEKRTADHQNEPHNRRHFRGGRRHQQHHYHHNRDRERERFEQYHVPHSSNQTTNNQAAAAVNAHHGNAHSSVSVANNTGGKHSKGNAHAR